MKKFILIILSISLISTEIFADVEKPIVACTASMISDMAENIFGDKADIRLIVPVGGDPHLHEPTPNDAQLVNQARLVLKNGLTFEGWLNELIENSGTKADVVRVTEGLKPISSLTYDNADDPHAWMDASNAIIYAENITKAAKKLLPKEAEYFDGKFENYKKELESTDAYILKRVSEIPKEHRVLITSHDAFQYYGKKYGIRLESTMGTSTDADVQTSDMNSVYSLIKKTGVPAIFIESTVNPKLIKQISKDLGVKIGGKLYADSIGEKGGPADSYIKMMRNNTDVIVDALTASKEENTSTTPEKTETGGSMTSIYGLLGVIVLLGLIFLFLRKKNS